MSCLPALLLALFVYAAGAAPPRIVASTYQLKETNLQGLQETHAIFQATADQDLYYLDDPVCGCVADMAECQQRALTYAPVNETGYTVTELAEGVWYDYPWVDFDAVRYFKLRLEPPAAGAPCPILMLERNSNIGDALVAVSNSFLPSAAEFQYVMYSWFKPKLWLCPHVREWGYGWWYIAVTGGFPRVEHLSYRLRWSTKAADACVPPPPRIAAPDPAAGDDWILLEDNQPLTVWFAPFTYYWFRFYVNATCTDVAFSARPYTPYTLDSLADFDLFVSWSNPRPTTMEASRNDFTSDTEHDDMIQFKRVCNPAGAPVSLFYLGIWDWSGTGVYGLITASTQSAGWHQSLLAHNGPLEIGYAMANDFARLYCGPDVRGAREIFRFSYPNWVGEQPGDEWGAMNAHPAAVTNDTLLVNHMWPPGNMDVPAFGFLQGLNWTSHPDYRVNARNDTLVLSMGLQLRSPGRVQRYAVSPVETCTLVWQGVVVNAQGEPLLGNTSFTRRELACDPAAFAAVYADAAALIASMVTLTDYAALEMAQTRLTFLSFTDAWQGCKAQMLRDFFVLADQAVALPDTSRCLEYADTDAWRVDPCCNVRSQLHACCWPSETNVTYTLPANIVDASVTAQCSVAQCARQSMQRYVAAAATIQDPATGCSARFDARAGPSAVAASTDFYKECRHEILGDRLEGIACASDADCAVPMAPYLSATCNARTFTCDYADADVLMCWARSMDPLVARALYDQWGIADNVNETRLLAELAARFMTPTCVGPTGLHYREMEVYRSSYTNCVDYCYDPSQGIDLQPYCFEQDAAYCPIPTVCSSWVPPANWCFRAFFHAPAQPESACVAEQSCNWLPCSSRFDAACEAACLNATGPTGASVCLECTPGAGCAATALAEAECQNTTIAGSCSLAGYTDQASCEAAGVCAGRESVYGTSIFEHYNRTGLCFSPFITDFLGSAYCGGAKPYDWPDSNLVQPEAHYGCVCSDSAWSHPACSLATTQQECAALGFLWVDDAATRTACEGAPARCFTSWQIAVLSPAGAYNNKTQEECTECAGEAWQPVHQWQPGVWSSAVPVSRFWVSKTFAPTNAWKPSIDYIAFGEAVAQATVARVALAYATEALCHYGAELDALSVALCDCNGGAGGASCYDAARSRPFATERVCPHLNATLSYAAVEVAVPSTAFPPRGFCQNLYLATYPASAFAAQVHYRLSSEVFLPRAASQTPYANVHNDADVIIGEIVTDGVNISWSSGSALDAPVTICLPTIAALQPDTSQHPSVAFGVLDAHGVLFEGSAVLSANGSVCFGVSAPGVYFGARAAADPANPVSPADRAMFAAASVLYLIIAAFGVAQAVRLARHRDHGGTSVSIAGFKPLVFAITFLFCVFRIVYMALAPYARSEGARDAMMFLFELPSALSFGLMTAIFIIWRFIVKRLKKLKYTTESAAIPLTFWASLGAALAVFVADVLAYYLVTEDAPPPCLSTAAIAPQQRHSLVNIVYLAITATARVALAALYVVMGSVFLWSIRELGGDGSSSAKRAARVATFRIWATFVPTFLVQSGLVIAAAVDPAFTVPVLVFAALECLPLLVLFFYLMPWANQGRVERTPTHGVRSGGSGGSGGSGSSPPGTSSARRTPPTQHSQTSLSSHQLTTATPNVPGSPHNSYDGHASRSSTSNAQLQDRDAADSEPGAD